MVTGIFVILTGVVLANNTRFGNVVVLQNLAHDIALTIRQAQVYGIAVRGAGSNFDVAYGVHFRQSSPAFELFADASLDGVYDPGETLLATSISGGYSISDICVTPIISGAEDCSLTELNIVFLRPEPDACINGSISGTVCTSAYRQARIVVSSARGDTAEVIIELTGQISAQ